MRKVVLLAVVLALAAPAWADDLFPPPWRGQPNTTYQAWTFDYDQGSYWVPENYNNPYGTPYIYTYYQDENWYGYWEGRQGVMEPWANEMYINLPNVPNPDDWKIVWVQMTWWSAWGYGPGFSFSDPPGQVMNEQQTDLGGGWFHSLYEIWIPGNPPFEMVAFYTDQYFDQIIVDTICIPEPASLGLLGLAGLVLLRRR